MKKSDIQGFSITHSKAAVIGCGGLGCNIAVHLAGSGVGEMWLCDFDTVSESNLNRQFLYGFEDIGKNKAEEAAKRIKLYSPGVNVHTVMKKIEKPQDLEFACGCDIIFLALDNNAARKAVSDFCYSRGIAFVNGGINGFYGSAYVCIPGKSPCLECAGLLQEENRTTFSISTTAGIVGALQAELGIRYLLKPSDFEGGVLYIYDNGAITKLKIKKGDKCRQCNNI